MRARKISMLVVAAAAAGLTLTACDSNSGSSDNGAASPSSSATGSAPSAPATSPSSSGGQNASGTSTSGSSAGSNSGAGKGSSGGSGGQAAGGTTCRTANLAFSSTHGMGEGDYLIGMKNTGAHACTMHGFPGADLKGSDGTVSAARSSVAAPHVTVQPGQEVRFTLHYPPNTSGGSGVTFTTLIVTPPNETHSHSMPLTVNVAAGTSSSPSITVDPVGAGK